MTPPKPVKLFGHPVKAIPREPMPSADSFRPIAPGQEQDVFETILGVESRLAHKIDQVSAEHRADLQEHDERLKTLEDANRSYQDARIAAQQTNQKIDTLSDDVRKVLAQSVESVGRDIVHEQRIGQLEAKAALAGSEAGAEAGGRAGGKAGRLWALIGTGLGTAAFAALAAFLQQCTSSAP